MKFCKRCLYSSDHPLGIVLDGDGICSGCRIHEEKNKLDWDYRKDKLQRLVKTYKTRKDFTYDCIVPVSGNSSGITSSLISSFVHSSTGYSSPFTNNKYPSFCSSPKYLPFIGNSYP